MSSDKVKETDSTDEKKEAADTKDKSKKKFIWIIVLTLILIFGTGTGIYFIWSNSGYISTDNARVTTTLVSVMPNAPGVLERLTVYEGGRVERNDILGWVENAEAMRSPINGLVINVDAVQEQIVSPQIPIAIIADTSNIHIQANIEETDIARLYQGQPAIVTIDTFGNRQFSGYISEIGRATNAELSGSALFFNTGGTFTRVTHLIPIEIVLSEDVDLEYLIGVNARVRIPLR